MEIGGHPEIMKCRGKSFKHFLAYVYHRAKGSALPSETVNSAVNQLASIAIFYGREYQLENRVAIRDRRRGKAIYYDLTDKNWRTVRVTSEGWKILGRPGILFRRYSHQRPQVEPVSGGDLGELLRFVNLKDPQQKQLLPTYLVSCLIPNIPHPIPIIRGPQGSAKTTCCRLLRWLIDPSATDVLSLPRSRDQLIQQLRHHWAPSYDNLSFLRSEISDELCQAVTGAGSAKRELYTDDDDVIYQIQNCILLNGINNPAGKSDLMGRAILFSLAPIPENKRKAEKQLREEFEEIRPALFGAMLDALSNAMDKHNSIRLERSPRMIDFAKWGCAIAMALSYSQQDFLSAFEQNEKDRNNEVLDDNSVADVVTKLMEGRKEWEGNMTGLLIRLTEVADDNGIDVKGKYWPKAPNSLSRKLNEVSTNLAAEGILLTKSNTRLKRRIHILNTRFRDDSDDGDNVLPPTSTPFVTRPIKRR